MWTRADKNPGPVNVHLQDRGKFQHMIPHPDANVYYKPPLRCHYLFKFLDKLECSEEKLKVKAPKQDIDITFGNWGSPIKMNKNPAQQLTKIKPRK